VPATAVLHLHDRDWVYASLGNGRFRRQEIASGAALPGNMQEVVSGLKPGEQVVSNALELENTVEQ
jgi:cobalt-zinc-cadmium efflux system membrane fusion protein